MSVFGGVFDMGGVDGDTSFFLLGRVINVLVLFSSGQIHFLQDGRDGGRESRFPVIDMPDCTDIQMGFISLVDLFLLCSRR